MVLSKSSGSGHSSRIAVSPSMAWRTLSAFMVSWFSSSRVISSVIFSVGADILKFLGIIAGQVLILHRPNGMSFGVPQCGQWVRSTILAHDILNQRNEVKIMIEDDLATVLELEAYSGAVDQAKRKIGHDQKIYIHRSRRQTQKPSTGRGCRPCLSCRHMTATLLAFILFKAAVAMVCVRASNVV